MWTWQGGKNTIRNFKSIAGQDSVAISPLWIAIATICIAIVGYMLALFMYWVKL